VSAPHHNLVQAARNNDESAWDRLFRANQLRLGGYPESLSGLVPGLLESVPRDAIDGEPLRYARTGDGHFTLYLIGPNGVDVHGALPKPGEPWWRSLEGDWAWPRPAGP